jgi:hypothetical protein
MLKQIVCKFTSVCWSVREGITSMLTYIYGRAKRYKDTILCALHLVGPYLSLLLSIFNDALSTTFKYKARQINFETRLSFRAGRPDHAVIGIIGDARRQELTWKDRISCIQHSLTSSALDHCMSSTLSRSEKWSVWVNVNFCVKLQKSPSKTLRDIKNIYGESPRQRSHGCQSPRWKQRWSAFSTSGVTHTLNLYLKGTTVTQTFCMEVLNRLLMPCGASEGSCGEVARCFFSTRTCRHNLRFECRSF